MNYQIFSLDEKKSNLLQGEEICSKCNGTGKYNKGVCNKCFGAGKLDWIDNIIGMNRKFFWWGAIDHPPKVNNYLVEIFDEMALKMAKEIDKEILETIFTNIGMKQKAKE